MIVWRRQPRASAAFVPPPETVKPGRHEFERVAPYYDALMTGVPYSRWVDYVEQLLAVYRVPALRALDLACGTGQVGSEMRRRGYHAVGADLSEPMIRLCAQRRPPLPAAVMDATRLGLRPACLDLAVCLFDSLNYILDPEGLQHCFAAIHEALRPGKLFIFDLNTPRALKIGLFSQQDLNPSARLQYRWEAHWDSARQLCRVDMWFRWQGEGGPLEFNETHYQRAYEEAQIAAGLREAGFARVDSFEGYSLRPVTPLTDRMYFVAQKASDQE